MTFNLTPKRLEALRWIKANPGAMVGYLAQALLSRELSDGTGKRAMWSQAATRMGAGYCKPLEAQGLVKIVTWKVTSGWGTVTITAAGVAALDAADRAAEDLAMRRALAE